MVLESPYCSTEKWKSGWSMETTVHHFPGDIPEGYCPVLPPRLVVFVQVASRSRREG